MRAPYAVICPWALTASPARGIIVPTEQQRGSKHIEESISKILSSWEFIEAIWWYLKAQTSNAEVFSPLYLPSTGHKFFLQSTPCCILGFFFCILLLVQLTWHSHSKLQFSCKLPWYSWGNGEGENIHRCRSTKLCCWMSKTTFRKY